MVLVEKSLDEMMEEIRFTELAYFDLWSPDEKPERHKIRDAGAYGWGMYVDTRSEFLRGVLDSSVPKDLGATGWGLLSNGTMICAFENSLKWGHNLEGYLMISLKVFIGEDGIIIRIRDSGSGFPWKEYVKM